MDFLHAGGLPDLVLRLLVAVLVGGVIGIDREMRRKPAGLKTHALVALGASLVVVVIIRATPPGAVNVDAVSRVIQGVIAGVGLLGGGAILKTNTSPLESVHGLTTAASIWLVAALGIACGAGQWLAAVGGALLALLVLVVGAPVERLIHRLINAKSAPTG
jgi:putative Mg2+ transporter-C (MgtC) family protein